MASYGHGCNKPRVSACGSSISTNFLCLAIILAPDMLESQSSALKSRMIA